jgi:hypothetical protein
VAGDLLKLVLANNCWPNTTANAADNFAVRLTLTPLFKFVNRLSHWQMPENRHLQLICLNYLLHIKIKNNIGIPDKDGG